MPFQVPSSVKMNCVRDLFLFKEASNKISIGEASKWYLFSHKTLKRIHHHLLYAKLIVLLHEPVER